MSHNHQTSEEEYFYKLNRDLINKQREKLASDRASLQEEEMKKAHWMKCPKCGHDLRDIELSGIKVDKCDSCEGMFFDAGELELLIKAQKPEGFFSHMQSTFFPKKIT